MQDLGTLIPDVRAASRALVREFGFLGQRVGGTDLSPSAAHALIEIGEGTATTAADLARRLLLDKSTISRLVRSMGGRGLIVESRSRDDARSKRLELTAAGRAVLADLARHAERQVGAALGPMEPERRATVLRGLDAYAAALEGARLGASPRSDPGPDAGPKIATGYHPGLLARIVGLHMDYHGPRWGMGSVFEAKVAAGFAGFLGRLERPDCETWHAHARGHIVAGITIDGASLGHGRAQLRWFIADAEAQGSGVGKRLMDEAMRFCDAAGFLETQLWTLRGLDAARALYERHGFALAEEWEGSQWGPLLVEQRFVRPRPA